MDVIILIPALLATAWCLAYSPSRAFLDVYVPVLLLAPVTYQFRLQGLPDLTLDKSAILPILVCWLAMRFSQWRWSMMDALLVLYVTGICASEFWNNGTAPARYLLFYTAGAAVAPYVLAKAALAGNENARMFAKRFVWLLVVISVISVLEFRLGLNLFRTVYGSFFPEQADPNVFVQYRWGYGRVAGPFDHAIFAGVFFSTALILQAWLSRARVWEPAFRWFRPGKRHVLTLLIIVGLAMTMSRGPWLSAICGLVIAYAGFVRRRQAILFVSALVLLISIGFATYASAFRVPPGTKAVWKLPEYIGSMAYRAELYERYEAIVIARPWSGYGTITWPRVQGMRSIDNAYLQLALSYGLMGLAPFVAMIVLAFQRLIRAIATARRPAPLQFALLGVMLSLTLNFTSVYLGNQAMPLLFLFLGWVEAETMVAAPEAVKLGARETVATEPEPGKQEPIWLPIY